MKHNTSHGARNGERRGGRKKGSRNKRTAEFAAAIEATISTKERLSILAELSRGIWVKEIVVTAKGEEKVKVYMEPPNERALIHLNEQQYGRPYSRTEIIIPPDAKTGVVLLPSGHPEGE